MSSEANTSSKLSESIESFPTLTEDFFEILLIPVSCPFRRERQDIIFS